MATSFIARSVAMQNEIDPYAYPIVPIYHETDHLLYDEKHAEKEEHIVVSNNVENARFSFIRYSITFLEKRFVISQGLLPGYCMAQKKAGALTYYGPPEEKMQVSFLIIGSKEAHISIIVNGKYLMSDKISSTTTTTTVPSADKICFKYKDYITVEAWIDDKWSCQQHEHHHQPSSFDDHQEPDDVLLFFDHLEN